MNGKLNVKAVNNNFDHLLANDHFQGDFLNKLNILFTFSNISIPFHEVNLIEGLP